MNTYSILLKWPKLKGTFKYSFGYFNFAQSFTSNTFDYGYRRFDHETKYKNIVNTRYGRALELIIALLLWCEIEAFEHFEKLALLAIFNSISMEVPNLFGWTLITFLFQHLFSWRFQSARRLWSSYLKFLQQKPPRVCFFYILLFFPYNICICSLGCGRRHFCRVQNVNIVSIFADHRCVLFPIFAVLFVGDSGVIFNSSKTEKNFNFKVLDSASGMGLHSLKRWQISERACSEASGHSHNENARDLIEIYAWVTILSDWIVAQSAKAKEKQTYHIL